MKFGSVELLVDAEFGQVFNGYSSTLTALNGVIVKVFVSPLGQTRIVPLLDKLNIEWWYREKGLSMPISFVEQSVYK